MRRELLHIYGPFSIQSYGLCIVIGLLLVWYLIRKDSRYNALQLNNKLPDILVCSIGLALAGGRLLYYLVDNHDIQTVGEFFSIWEGGFSLLGTIITLVASLPLLLRWYKIPILPFLDLIAPYAPLLQGVSRIGCFLAGCCYGAPTAVAWAVKYTDRESLAPLYRAIHPTQLYSALLLACTSAFLYFYARDRLKKPGQLFSLYLMMISIERFVVDFWRADRVFYTSSTHTYFPIVSSLSVHQLTAFALFCGGMIMFMYVSRAPYQDYE